MWLFLHVLHSVSAQIVRLLTAERIGILIHQWSHRPEAMRGGKSWVMEVIDDKIFFEIQECLFLQIINNTENLNDNCIHVANF